MSDLEKRIEHRIPDLSEPSVEGLAYLLRHKKLWPKDFHWWYDCFGTCAIGLMVAHWKLEPVEFMHEIGIQHCLGMPLSQARAIFVNLAATLGRRVKPEDVAKALDEVVREFRV